MKVRLNHRDITLLINQIESELNGKMSPLLYEYIGKLNDKYFCDLEGSPLNERFTVSNT